MDEKLSDELSAAWTLLNNDGDRHGVCDAIKRAIRLAKAVEHADEYVFGELSHRGCAVLVALPSFYGKRVKLVEA